MPRSWTARSSPSASLHVLPGDHRVLPSRHGQDPLPAPALIHDAGPGPGRDPRQPEHPQDCCTQQTSPSRPQITAKTAQKHDYPSTAHRRSYARRTGAERGFATAKDPATNDITRGWCRLMGLVGCQKSAWPVSCSDD
jgi:hypothetical protein